VIEIIATSIMVIYVMQAAGDHELFPDDDLLTGKIPLMD